MLPRSSRHSPSLRKDKSSSRTKKTDDWTEVMEPDERRRIQNRIAQRKFREKAREQRDRAVRDAQNQQYAGSAYRVPSADNLSPLDDAADLSGLPWGGLSMRHVVARGHHACSAVASSSAHTVALTPTTTTTAISSSSSSRAVSVSQHHSPAATPATRPVDMVDHALYHMNPYGGPGGGGYQHHHAPMGGFDAGGDGGSGSDVAAYYDSPYGGYYHDFEAGAGGDGAAQGM